MSGNPALEPHCPEACALDATETVIIPRARDIGEFVVRRALPSPTRKMVGPFVLFGQMIHHGAVNWMIAGNGVTHSESASAAKRRGASSLFGVQTWVALPEEHESIMATRPCPCPKAKARQCA